MIVFSLIIILIVLCFLLYKNLKEERKKDAMNLNIQSIYQFSNMDSGQRCPECDGVYLKEKEQCAVCGFNNKKGNRW